MKVGCYVLHLYCDACNATWNNGNGTEKNEAEALTVARSQGWKVSPSPSGVAVWCPKHHPKRSALDKPFKLVG